MRLIPAHLNLKQRVVLALTALVAIFVIVQGSLAYFSMAEQEDDLVDELVLAEARRLATHIGQDDATGMQATSLVSLSPHFSGWLRTHAGVVVPMPLPLYLAPLSVGPHVLKDNDAELHAYVMPVAEGTLYVQYDAAQHEAKVHQFGYYLLGLGALCIGLAALIATQMATIVVAPIERLSRMLAEWAPGSLPTDETDEETQLLTAFRRVQERFEEGLAHEREFVANARHEVRTPLTALRTDLEMLTVHAPADLQARLLRAISTVDEISGSLDLAHTLSQRHTLNAEPVDLAACLDAAWASLAQAEETRLVFRNQVNAEVRIVADRHALLTILRNLIRNAAEHASATVCTVSYTERGIEIADDGVGISAEDLPLVFDRYYRGRRMDALGGNAAAGERGLGLAIARQIADLNRWALSVESVPGKGTCFILNLTVA